MPQKKYLITLGDEEREHLDQLLHGGTHATRKVTRARILLQAAEGWEDGAIAAALSVGRATVERLRQRCVEDVLEVYAEPYDPKRPKVNFDETNTQLLKETRLPLPARPGQLQRFDDAYERNGTRNLFLFVEPQAGRRHVQVTEQRTKVDFAHA